MSGSSFYVLPARELFPGLAIRFTWSEDPEIVLLVSVSTRPSNGGRRVPGRDLLCLTRLGRVIKAPIGSSTPVEVVA